MIKRSFFGWTSPVLEYETSRTPIPVATPIDDPDRVVLFAEGSFESPRELALEVGASVKAGEKLLPFSGRDVCVVSPVAGRVTDVVPAISATGQPRTAITIETAHGGPLDDGFQQIPAGETGPQQDYLSCLPGKPLLGALDTEAPATVRQIVITAADADLLVLTNRYVLQHQLDDLKTGIAYLKTFSGIDRVTVVAPSEMIQGYGHLGATVANIAAAYPSAFPDMVIRKVFQPFMPEGDSVQRSQFAFFSAESVAAIGVALRTGRLPMKKKITVIDKNGRRRLVAATIGTPISKIFESLNLDVQEKDRIVAGGPMTGVAIYDEHLPVEADMDALMLQPAAEITRVSDYPCINCGECIRICPAKIPVNMLIRFLEFGDYATAADEYDLESCIECGLCSYVCVSRIPVFQYIMLAKHELAKAQAVEAVDE